LSIGRPPGWLLVNADVFLEAIKVGAKGRCTVPAGIRHGFAWFSRGEEVLADLRPGGRMVLLPWSFATDPKARLEELKAEMRGPDGGQAADQLLRLQDRFQRLRVDTTTTRLELPDHVAAHLGVMDGGTIFAVRFPDHIELWSETFREGRLAEAELADLNP
jgi:hypothetical protein